MTSPAREPRFVDANGLRMAVYEAGVGPAVVLLHGFPELAHSWRHQMQPLADAGWRAIACDLRGYGETGAHGPVEAYSMRNLSSDVIGMLDALQIDRAVLIGHDFGGALAWSLARDHASRIAGIMSLNTPYTRRGTRSLLQTMLQHRGETNYMVQFQTPGVGEGYFERDVAAIFRGLMRRPGLRLDRFRRGEARLRALPMSLFGGESGLFGEPIMTDEDLMVYVAAFERNGFTGPLNWYRNLEANWLDGATAADRVGVPAAMVTASDDYFLPPDTTRGMEQQVPDLERYSIDDCGHWTQQERPEKVNRIMLDWLERRMRGILDPAK